MRYCQYYNSKFRESLVDPTAKIAAIPSGPPSFHIQVGHLKEYIYIHKRSTINSVFHLIHHSMIVIIISICCS